MRLMRGPWSNLIRISFYRSRSLTYIRVLVVGRLYDSGREHAYDPQYQRVIDFRKSFNFHILAAILDN